ncbi:unnamed protein product [Arabidopsis halleri]
MSRLWFFGDDQLDLKHSKTGTVAMTSGGENLNASENGCFKCGSTNHVTKDCVGCNQSLKFIVKDQNRQHGGGQGYDMVFEGDIPEIPKRDHSHDRNERGSREKIRRRSPHANGEGKRRHRDESDTEDKADKYIGRRQHHRAEIREMERRYDDGISRDTERKE